MVKCFQKVEIETHLPNKLIYFFIVFEKYKKEMTSF